MELGRVGRATCQWWRKSGLLFHSDDPVSKGDVVGRAFNSGTVRNLGLRFSPGPITSQYRDFESAIDLPTCPL